MILKDKELQNVKSANTIAGQKQELDVAFYLRREFKDHPEVFIINDYKFSHNDETAQIDHLIVYPFGFILIESKSISGEVKVNQQGEWTRSHKSKWSGMPSPIKQVELQEQLLNMFLHHHRAKILGKILGFKQQSFQMRCWNNLCAVSSNAIIERESMPSKISETIVKSEFLVDKINVIMNLKSALMQTLSVLDTRPAFNAEELCSITSFLINYSSPKPIKAALEKVNEMKEKESSLQCKKCGETSDYTPQNGRFGYFINCNKCNTNTPMKMPCIKCKSKKTKVSKKKEKFTLNCLDCDNQLSLIQ
jgi:hypothetical protein